MTPIRDLINRITLNLPFSPFMVAKKTNHGELAQLIHRLTPQHSGRSLIRIGPEKDGGYLLPDDLDGIHACYSPGVADEAGFELECANRGMQVFMADASVSAPPINHSKFAFIPKYLGSTNSDTHITLDSWVDQTLSQRHGDLILQIDIEGSEYEVFINTSEELMSRFRVIVVEFHHLDYLFDSTFFHVAKAAFEKILKHHQCVHIHPNNTAGVINSDGIGIPKTMEFTFFRKDRITATQEHPQIPHLLDVDCDPNRKSIQIPNCWK